jgi:hypothetical protein
MGALAGNLELNFSGIVDDATVACSAFLARLSRTSTDGAEPLPRVVR